MPPSQEGLVGIGMNGAFTIEARALLRRDLDLDFTRDRLRDVALQPQHVVEVAVVAAGPEVAVAGTVDQLRRDSHPVAVAEDRSLHEGIDTERERHFWQRRTKTLVARHGRSRRHPQRPDLRQVPDDRLGHPVDEVLLFRIPRQVVERQHGQRANPAPRLRPAVSSERWMSAHSRTTRGPPRVPRAGRWPARTGPGDPWRGIDRSRRPKAPAHQAGGAASGLRMIAALRSNGVRPANGAVPAAIS